MSPDGLGERLAERLEAADRGLLLVLTGAGVSLASGIPTFRGTDPGAIWKRDVTELGTLDYFRRDPVGSWSWYLQRFDVVLDKEPNAAHHALAALERWQVERGGDFLLVTQNIDTLHEQAGSERLIKVHGSADRVRCSRDGCEHGSPAGSLPRPEAEIAHFREQPELDRVPRCPACGSLMRQHVLWFDEVYSSHGDYRWEEVLQGIERMHLALCVGTSFAVGVTEAVLQAGLWTGIPILSIDPGSGTPIASRGLEQLSAKAEELLPDACRRLDIAL